MRRGAADDQGSNEGGEGCGRGSGAGGRCRRQQGVLELGAQW
jgi:hypothetical protein